MKFDITQRITLLISILSGALFLAHTLHIYNESKNNLVITTEADQNTSQSEQSKSVSSEWNVETQTRLRDDLKSIANEYTSVNLLMANIKHKPLAESLTSIFKSAGWRADMTNVPLESYINNYFTGIEVQGYNKYFVETVADYLRKAGLKDVKTNIEKHNFMPNNPKKNYAEHSIKITIGHQD